MIFIRLQATLSPILSDSTSSLGMLVTPEENTSLYFILQVSIPLSDALKGPIFSFLLGSQCWKVIW